MMVLGSEKQCRGVERSLSGGLAKGVSPLNEEFERSMIVVVYTYQDFLPENLDFRQVADAEGWVCAVHAIKRLINSIFIQIY